VDGLDTLTQPIPAGVIGPTSGKLTFNTVLRHGDGDLEKFGTTNPMLFEILFNSSNRIYAISTNNNSLSLYTVVGGVVSIGLYDMAGIVAGQLYAIEIEYTDTQCTMSVDGAVVVTVTPGAGIDFGANIPNAIWLGSRSTGSQQYDAVFS
jgi:hypothetical protein